MQLFKEVLIKLLEKEDITVLFPNLKTSAAEIVEMKCYEAVQRIKAIVENDGFSDEECFMQIEEIVCALEDIGSSGGNRHDFG